MVRFIRVILCLVLAATASGCAKPGSDGKERAAQLLEEKYSESFRIVRETKNSGTYFDVVASPKNNPEILFTASIDKNDDNFSDDYVNRIVCWKINQMIIRNISSIDDFVDFNGVKSSRPIPGDIQSYTHTIGFKAQCDNKEIPIQEYASLTSDFKVRTDLFILPDSNMDPGDLYWHLSNAYDGIRSINGNIMLYVVNNRQMRDVRNYLNENADLGLEFSEMAEEYITLFVSYEDGVPEMSEAEFTRAYAEAVKDAATGEQES